MESTKIGVIKETCNVGKFGTAIPEAQADSASIDLQRKIQVRVNLTKFRVLSLICVSVAAECSF